MPLAVQGPDLSAALTFDLGKTKSMIFLQYQLKVQTRHSFPGYNALKFRFLTNIHKLRDINSKKGLATSINGQGERSTQRRIIHRQPARWVEVRVYDWGLRSAYA